MTTPAISLNPVKVSNFPGTFSAQSTGYIQGLFQDDPAIRNSLAGGILDTVDTLPMWGGIAILEKIPTPGPSTGAPHDALGGLISRAADYAHITGFSVFNQAGAMVVSAQSNVPLAGTGMGVNFFRLGSGARIAVQCDPALASIEGDPITQPVSWDFVNQKLVAFSSTALACKVLGFNIGNSKIVSYDSVNNFANWTQGSVAIIQI